MKRHPLLNELHGEFLRTAQYGNIVFCANFAVLRRRHNTTKLHLIAVLALVCSGALRLAALSVTTYLGNGAFADNLHSSR